MNQSNDFKKLTVTLLGILSPLLFIILFEQLILPANYFNFRNWESLSVKSTQDLFPGPFYPSRKSEMIEEGDLGHHSPKAVKRFSRWEIDSYGFRNSPSICNPFKVTLVGDSNAVGTGLNQDETLAAVLIHQHQICTYSFATASMTNFLNDYERMFPRPDVVVMPRIERALSYLEELTDSNIEPSLWKDFLWTVRMNAVCQRVFEFLDKTLNSNLLYYIRSRFLTSNIKNTIQHWRSPPDPEIQAKLSLGERISFLEGAAANAERSDSDVIKIATTLEQYSKELHKRGIRFIFLAVPNKESILYSLVPAKPANFLPRLFVELKNRNVEYIDLHTRFSEEFSKGILTHQLDDTHWNAHGVGIAAELIQQRLTEENR